MTSRATHCTPQNWDCIVHGHNPSSGCRYHWTHVSSSTFSLANLYPSRGTFLTSWNSQPTHNNQILPILSIKFRVYTCVWPTAWDPSISRFTITTMDSWSSADATGTAYAFLSNYKVACQPSCYPMSHRRFPWLPWCFGWVLWVLLF